MRLKSQYQFKDEADEFWWNQLDPEAQAYAIYMKVEDNLEKLEAINVLDIGGALEVSSDMGAFVVYSGSELNDWIDATVQGLLASGLLESSEFEIISRTKDIEQILNIIGTPLGMELDGSVEVIQETFYFFK